MHRRRKQQRRVDVARRRQIGDQFLRKVRRHLRRLREHGSGSTDHFDRFCHAGKTHLHVDRQGLRRRDRDGALLALEPAQLERNGVLTRRQQREDVVAVLRSDGGPNPLKVRRLHAHRHARDRAVLRVDHAAGNRAGCALRVGDVRHRHHGCHQPDPQSHETHRKSSKRCIGLDRFESMTHRPEGICSDFDHSDTETS